MPLCVNNVQIPYLIFQSINYSFDCTRVLNTRHFDNFLQKFGCLKLTVNIYRIDLLFIWFHVNDCKQGFEKLGVQLCLKLSILEIQQVAHEVQETVKEPIAFNCLRNTLIICSVSFISNQIFLMLYHLLNLILNTLNNHSILVDATFQLLISMIASQLLHPDSVLFIVVASFWIILIIGWLYIVEQLVQIKNYEQEEHVQCLDVHSLHML